MGKETIYLTLEDFQKLLNDGVDDIIAVKINDLFLNNFDMSSFHPTLIRCSNYYIFNRKNGFNLIGGFSEQLKDEPLVEKIYVISESLTKTINNMINDVMILSEAAELWGITEGALRKAIAFNRFRFEEFRKAGRITLITRNGMERVYGLMKPMSLQKVTYEEMERFILNHMEYTYNVKDVLREEISELDNNCEMVFEMHDCKFKIAREVTIIDEENEEFEDLFDVEKL